MGAVNDPTRADLVSAVGDLTSSAALVKLEKRMMADPQGKLILEERPRVTSITWNTEEMIKLPQDTFGY